MCALEDRALHGEVRAELSVAVDEGIFDIIELEELPKRVEGIQLRDEAGPFVREAVQFVPKADFARHFGGGEDRLIELHPWVRRYVRCGIGSGEHRTFRRAPGRLVFLAAPIARHDAPPTVVRNLQVFACSVARGKY